MTERLTKLSQPQLKLLRRACSFRGESDGVPFKGYSGRLRSARILERLGLAKLLIPGEGRMPRIFGTAAGRTWLQHADGGRDRKRMAGEAMGLLAKRKGMT